MAEVTLFLNGRGYRIACADGQEPHIDKLGRYIETKVQDLVRQVGQVGDARLLAMASLVIADELSEARGGIDGATPLAKPADAAAQAIEAVAKRIDALAARLEAT
ncbi:MAG: cell division protein ZapA [Alphaproteobacteria bacterium]|nr:cell division protein ZapA [Alphaproteobacteria bacterium]